MPNLTALNSEEFYDLPENEYIAPAVERIAPSTFYSDVAKNRLTNQFQEKPILQGLCNAMVSPLDATDDIAESLTSKRWISSAEGLQLDNCGSIVGELRQGRSDFEYRRGIYFRIFLNTSNGNPEDIINATRFLTSPDDIQYIEQYPSSAMIFTDGSTASKSVQSVVQGVSPAALCDVPVIVTFANAKPFRFSIGLKVSELFVNSDMSYLTANDSDIQISSSIDFVGSRLGGLAAADLDVNGFLLDVGIGSLAINDSNNSVVIESNYHLPGVFQ